MELYKNYIIHQGNSVKWTKDREYSLIVGLSIIDFGEGPFIIENLEGEIATLSCKGRIIPEHVNTCYLISA